ncbi:Scr1 family TA system antitoxin-like transcriptional regulator [Kitasatospora sp. NPDC001603]|uniref:Scr1 family TA system antitoxin-like transcriptional regulator n=1 Tax=Kitasatospora sp. NPDC001603 TaxID=3154388 RepID=UPI003325363B
MTHIPPDTRRRLGALLLGAHLRHLRECQNLTSADVAERAPGPHRVSAGDVSDVEAGRTPVPAFAGLGRLGAVLGACGGGRIALADYHQVLAACQREDLGAALVDDALAWPHRYQLLEQEAARVLLAATATVPGPLRTEQTWAALSMEGDYGVPVPRAREFSAPSAVPGAGCELCVMYRADPLAQPGTRGAWQRAVAEVRAAAFDKRIRRGGATEAVVLLDEGVLYRRGGSARIHAAQMGHLADLTRHHRLQVRVVPFNAGALLRYEMAELDLGDGRTVTASLGDAGVSYRDGPDPSLRLAMERSLGPDISGELLDKAAAGTLRPPRRGW